MAEPEFPITFKRSFTRGELRVKEVCTGYGSLCAFRPTYRFSGYLKYVLTNASSNKGSYVVKPVTPFLYDQAFRLQEELSFSSHIRLPVDGNNPNRALIFQHYTEDFLSFMQSGPVSRLQVKRILWDILKGIAACHSKDWVHCGNNLPTLCA